MKYLIDGNQVCCVDVHFKCLTTCHAGFGPSLEDAFINYWQAKKQKPSLRDLEEWELPWARKDLAAIEDLKLEQTRKGFWLGFEDARCHPDEMNILTQWEETKVFIDADKALREQG